MDNLFNKLIDIFKTHSKVVIMAHHDPDLDAISSSLALSYLLSKLDIENYIFLSKKRADSYTSSVAQVLMRANNNNYIYPSTYKEIIDDETVLAILDVHQKERLEYPNIINKIKKVVILDHHIKSNSYIRDTELFYIDSTLSSMAEFMVWFANYLNINYSIFLASVLLAGVEVDTNGFTLKTTEKTFTAAASLASMGADSVLKQELLKESKDTYLRRADFIRSSYVINKNIAICPLSEPVSTKEELAEIAEELLKLEYVEASFAIGQLKRNEVGISARSIGNINVCEIMKRLGGGGHITNAASQLNNSTVKETERKLHKVLEELE